jgi:MurNAc alpha-1-phosphate uridylyltransferase
MNEQNDKAGSTNQLIDGTDTAPLTRPKVVSKAMLFAAGIGSRLKPWTDTNPKALAIVNGKTLLQRNIQYLQQCGITEVVVNVHHFAEKIIDTLEANKGWGSKITISNESNSLLETGGGLLKAAEHLQGEYPFVVMNADILTDMNLASMINYHQEKKPMVTLATSGRESSRYFLFDDGNNLCGWRNTKTGEERTSPAHNLNGTQSSSKALLQKAFSGIHIIEPKIFSFIKQQGKFSLVDVYLDLMNDHTIKSFDDIGSRFIDVGKPGSIAIAEGMFLN